MDLVAQDILGAVGTLVAGFEGVAGVEGVKGGQFSVCDGLGRFSGAVSTVEGDVGEGGEFVWFDFLGLLMGGGGCEGREREGEGEGVEMHVFDALWLIFEQGELFSCCLDEGRVVSRL